jgi:hypothetical protein
MRFHTFITEDVPQELVGDHRAVCRALDIDVQYHIHPKTSDYNEVYTAHGAMMNTMMEEETEEVVCFLDIDCLPWNPEVLEHCFDYAKSHYTFVGNAQNISHTHMRNRLYAAASTLFVSKQAWRNLGKTRLDWYMAGNTQVDTAQALSLVADEIGYEYKLLYPLGSDEISWPLGNFGHYGKGTVYPGSYHYFQLGRPSEEPLPELWKSRVKSIIAGERIVPAHKPHNW